MQSQMSGQVRSERDALDPITHLRRTPGRGFANVCTLANFLQRVANKDLPIFEDRLEYVHLQVPQPGLHGHKGPSPALQRQAAPLGLFARVRHRILEHISRDVIHLNEAALECAFQCISVELLQQATAAAKRNILSTPAMASNTVQYQLTEGK